MRDLSITGRISPTVLRVTWTDDGTTYHLFVSQRTLQPSMRVLHADKPPYHRDPQSSEYADMVATVLERLHCDGHIHRHLERERTTKEAINRERAQLAGPALFEALGACVERLIDLGECHDTPTMTAARNAMGKVCID